MLCEHKIIIYTICFTRGIKKGRRVGDLLKWVTSDYTLELSNSFMQSTKA